MLADLFHSGEDVLESPSLKEKKTKQNTNFTAASFQCGSFLVTLYLPHGVKKAKGSSESDLLLNKCRPILKNEDLVLTKKKNPTPIDKGNIPRL